MSLNEILLVLARKKVGLRRYLAGQALATVSGLTYNSENYKEALDILIDRYGNPQVLISAHMETLVRIKGTLMQI